MMRKLLIICIIIVLSLTFISCSNKEKVGGREIYIPILADATWITADGAFINGVQLAVEDVNKDYSSKGFNTKIDVIDDQALYEKGVEIATKVAEDTRVTAVFNLQNFDVSKTTAEILTMSGKLTLFPYGAYDSLFTKDNPLIFCGVPASSDLGQAMADYALKNGFKRIAVYHNGKQSQEELVTAFELKLLNTQTKIVDYVPAIASANAFDNIYRRWQTLGVDGVLISQYGLEQAFNILKMLRAKDTKLAVIGEPIFNRANALAENKAVAEGMMVPSTLVIDESERLKGFKAQYRQRYGQEADIWAVQGYDMIRMVVDTAVRLDTNDPAKIAGAMHEEAGYQGIGRQMAFAKGGAIIVDVNKLPALICRDGMFQ
ncbi:MAG: ABC transporter substrate-binding protein [Syntrophomonas sp.]|nr:ABC transporter substrate-binding protein [Syntrophomonas sp.]